MATANWYGLAGRDQWGATAADRVDWVTDTIKVSIHGSGYTWDQDAHDYYNDVTSEVSGTNYTAGGVTLGSKTLTYDTATNTVRLKSADAVWTTVTFTAGTQAVIRKDTGSAATSHLMGRVDFGGSQSPTAVNFEIRPDATDGWLRAVVS